MPGFPDSALQRANEAVALASRPDHPFSVAYSLFYTGALHLWRRELELVQGHAETALALAEKHESQTWEAVVTCLHGAALAGLGRVEEGLRENNLGMALYHGLKTPRASCTSTTSMPLLRAPRTVALTHISDNRPVTAMRVT
jgi:hypothetical protein